MKYLPAAVAVLAVFAAGCASGVKLPPVEPQDVEVFLQGSYPTEEYKVMSTITEQVSLETDDRDLIEQARERAAKLGADALVVTSIRSTTEGGIDLDTAREAQKILEGLAIYYPSRHAEIEQ